MRTAWIGDEGERTSGYRVSEIRLNLQLPTLIVRPQGAGVTVCHDFD